MSQTGSLLIRVFTSRAQLPISDATVVVSSTGADGRQHLLSVQLTDESGLTLPIQLDAPDRDLSQTPGSPFPFASYSVVVEHPGYYLALYDQLQVFSGVETVQNVILTPLPQPEEPGSSDSAPPVTVTPQPL